MLSFKFELDFLDLTQIWSKKIHLQENSLFWFLVIISLLCLVPKGGGSSRTGLSAVLRGLRRRGSPGPPAEPHPLLHPRQRNHPDEDPREMGSTYHQCPQKGDDNQDFVCCLNLYELCEDD